MVGVIPTSLFDKELVDWDRHRGEWKFIVWIMKASLYSNVFLFSAQFTADAAW
jgi:hypothetical protein